MVQKIKFYPVHRLVKSEDLNHHGTLFAGRAAEWFVESGFVAASTLLPPRNIICLKIHGMTFQRPVRAGNTICFEGCIIAAGKTSLTAYVKMHHVLNEELIVDGFITFVHVDENARPVEHGITIEVPSEYDDILKRVEALSRHTH